MSMRPTPPGSETWYVCKVPGCGWARREPPKTMPWRAGLPPTETEAANFANALRDLALDYDHHEANEHPDSRDSGLTTETRIVREPNPEP